MCPSYCIEKDFTISLKWTSFRSLQIILTAEQKTADKFIAMGFFLFNWESISHWEIQEILLQLFSIISLVHSLILLISKWFTYAVDGGWRDAKRKLFFSRMFRNRIRISGHIFLTKTSAMALSHLFHCHLSLASSIKRSSDTKKDTASSYLLTMEFLQFTSFSGVRHFYLKLVVIVN